MSTLDISSHVELYDSLSI